LFLPQRHIPVEHPRAGLHYSILGLGLYRYGNEVGVNIYAGGDRAIRKKPARSFEVQVL
jgi:hypothetical protein